MQHNTINTCRSATSPAPVAAVSQHMTQLAR